MSDATVLFAGPGGSCLGIHNAGLTSIGVEWDSAACETRRAAGLATVEGDVRAFDPLDDLFATPGFWASPPCQTFSAAGGGSGAGQLAEIVQAVLELDFRKQFHDDRTSLILEPLRWILTRYAAERPYAWIAFEQVPTVLQIWKAYRTVLEDLGYSVDCDNVLAERHGVPQTRKRAILVARLEGEARLPAPTHSKYYNRDPKRLEPGLPKWISMAEALGWESDFEVVSNYGSGGDPTKRGVRFAVEPSATITSKFDRNKVVFLSDNRPNSAVRGIDEPAPTIIGHGGKGAAGGTHHAWVFDRPAPTIVGTRRSDVGMLVGRQLGLAEGRHVGGRDWTGEAPKGLKPGQLEAVRLTAAEAGVLQTFPADWPWTGTKSQQAMQVGNAAPPTLVAAIVRGLVF